MYKKIERVFNGNKYTLDDVCQSLRSANKSVASYHDKGYLARITRITTRLFGVWIKEIKR